MRPEQAGTRANKGESRHERVKEGPTRANWPDLAWTWGNKGELRPEQAETRADMGELRPGQAGTRADKGESRLEQGPIRAY